MRWFLVLMMLFLGACEAETGQQALVGRNQDEDVVLAGLPAFESGADLNLPEVFGGELFFVQGYDLYRSRFDGQPAERLIKAVDPPGVIIHPHGDYIIYKPRTGLDLLGLNLETGQTVSLGGIGILAPRLHSWSPDGEWAILSLSEAALRLARLSDGLAYTFSPPAPDLSGMPAGTTLPSGVILAGWLESNRALIFHQAVSINTINGIPPKAYLVIPETGEEFDVDIAPEEIGRGLTTLAYAKRLNTSLVNQGYKQLLVPDVDGQLSPVDEAADHADIFAPFSIFEPWDIARMNYLNSDDCIFNWSIGRQSTQIQLANRPTKFYEASVARLTDIQALGDGSLVFLEWSAGKCPPAREDIHVRLRHWSKSGIQTIAEQVFLTGTYNLTYPMEPIYFGSPSLFTISPNKAYIAWVEETEPGHYAIMIGDSEGNKAALTTSTEPYRFLYWLPRSN